MELQEKLRGVIHATEDRVLFAALGPVEGRGKGAITTMGRGYEAPEVVAIVV